MFLLLQTVRIILLENNSDRAAATALLACIPYLVITSVYNVLTRSIIHNSLQYLNFIQLMIIYKKSNFCDNYKIM